MKKTVIVKFLDKYEPKVEIGHKQGENTMNKQYIENIRKELNKIEDEERYMQEPCECCGRILGYALEEIEQSPEEYSYIEFKINGFVLDTPTGDFDLGFEYCPRCGRKL